jgi:hypothetical protein
MEIIAVYSENYMGTTKIKRKGYLMLKRLVHIATIRLSKVKLNHDLFLPYLFQFVMH